MTIERQEAGGLRVGPYSLLSKLGEGGMGVVHLARHAETGARVALKVMRTHVVGDDETRSRLAREVRSLEQVHSPWIAEILDADPFGETPYVATRYVPGATLHDVVKRDGPIAGADRLWLARCLADGIAACHDAGVLHRDVKPTNVVMEGRTPVLIDFGLARVADDPKITVTGWLLGTPGYLAPEILEGAEATAASDIHGWGATMAYALAGHPPYGTGPSMAILDRARRGEHDLAGIEQPLLDIVTAALATDPDARPGLPELRERLGSADAPAPVLTQQLPETVALAAASDGSLTAAPVTPVTIADEPLPATLVDPDAAAPDAAAPEAPVTEVTVAEQPKNDEVVIRRFDAPPAPEPTAPWSPASVHSGVWRGAGATRRLLILLALGVAGGGVVAAYPLVGLGFLALVVWLLRSASMATAHLEKRRRERGRRSYDAAQVLARSPWDVVRALPGSLALMVWTGVIGVAAGLGSRALNVPVTGQLYVGAVVFMAMVWLASGRVRESLGGLVRTASDGWQRWVVVFVGAVIVAGVIVWYTTRTSASWVPWTDVHTLWRHTPDLVRHLVRRVR